jgi:uncharacterized OsmC-like protein
MVSQHTLYLGELRMEAVHDPSGVRLVTDAPVDNHGRGQSFSPTDLLVTSLATCKVTTAAIALQPHGVKLDGTKVYAEKHMSTDPPRRIARILVRIELPVGIPRDLRRLLESAARGCPVARSLHPDVVIDLDFSYPD